RADVLRVAAQTDARVRDPSPNEVAELMARRARLEAFEIIPILETEPISFTAAVQIREHLTKQHVRSVIVVAPGFRSRRSSLVYHTVLRDAGMQVSCTPIFGRTTPQSWMNAWHGIQEV